MISALVIFFAVFFFEFFVFAMVFAPASVPNKCHSGTKKVDGKEMSGPLSGELC